MNKTLKPLETHNKKKAVVAVATVMNGIACPDCGNELEDTSPNKTVMTDDPKKGVKCSCGYSGFRNAEAVVDADNKTVGYK